MQKHCNAYKWVLLASALSVVICGANANETTVNSTSVVGSRKKESNSVKKDLPEAVDLPDSSLQALVQQSPMPSPTVQELTQSQRNQSAPVVVIGERPTTLLAQSGIHNSQLQTSIVRTDATETSSKDDDDVQIVQTRYNPNDLYMPDAYRASFYFFFGISSVALLFIVVRVYRLRLSRAERKYGVQGDRANQELTPLPMAIEDINSDEDDHTLFEINRHNIRIF